jgi:hypothetical protein
MEHRCAGRRAQTSAHDAAAQERGYSRKILVERLNRTYTIYTSTRSDLGVHFAPSSAMPPHGAVCSRFHRHGQERLTKEMCAEDGGRWTSGAMLWRVCRCDRIRWTNTAKACIRRVGLTLTLAQWHPRTHGIRRLEPISIPGLGNPLQRQDYRVTPVKKHCAKRNANVVDLRIASAFANSHHCLCALSRLP